MCTSGGSGAKVLGQEKLCLFWRKERRPVWLEREREKREEVRLARGQPSGQVWSSRSVV